MNEPAVFETPTKTMPVDNLHRIDSDDFAPRDATHAEVHKCSACRTRAARSKAWRLRPGVRPFVMTRASYAGGQRYAVTWTGDNSSTWDHLRLCVSNPQPRPVGLRLQRCDVGGFIGGASPDLLTRWYEIAAFTPVFRNHAANDAPHAEPWVDGPEHLAIRRKFIEERYRLMPYLYALADQNARTGDPVMRPLFYDYPDALKFDCDSALTFTVGRELLVPPRRARNRPSLQRSACPQAAGTIIGPEPWSASISSPSLLNSINSPYSFAPEQSSQGSRSFNPRWRLRPAHWNLRSIRAPTARASSISTME